MSGRNFSNLQLALTLFHLWHSTPAYAKRNQFFDARVYRVPGLGRGDLAVKVVKSLCVEATKLLYREHEFLAVLSHRNIVSYQQHAFVPGYYVLFTDWIDGYCLQGNVTLLRSSLKSNEEKERFRATCWGIIDVLNSQGIAHRDIREKNIVIRRNEPILFDFGWAIWHNETDVFTPDGLQNPDDPAAMAAVLQRVLCCEGLCPCP